MPWWVLLALELSSNLFPGFFDDKAWVPRILMLMRMLHVSILWYLAVYRLFRGRNIGEFSHVGHVRLGRWVLGLLPHLRTAGHPGSSAHPVSEDEFFSLLFVCVFPSNRVRTLNHER